jgi:hypothetical protein
LSKLITRFAFTDGKIYRPTYCQHPHFISMEFVHALYALSESGAMALTGNSLTEVIADISAYHFGTI